MRARIRSVLGIEESRGAALAARVLATIRKPGIGQNSSSSPASRRFAYPAGCSRRTTPDLPHLPAVCRRAAAWSSVAEDAFAERLCAKGGCRVAVIDVRGRGDCAIAYPQRGRFYFPEPHRRRSLPDVVHADARQAASRRTGLRHAAGAGLSAVAAGRRRAPCRWLATGPRRDCALRCRAR